MDYNYNSDTTPNNKFPIWIVVVLLVVLCLCLSTAGLIGAVVSNDTFQETVSELFNEGMGPSNDVDTSLPTSESASTAVSTISASAVKKTPVPTSLPFIATDIDSLQAAIAPYTKGNIVSRPPIYRTKAAGMKHNLNDYIKTVDADVQVTNFVVDALFYNPFAADENSWDIGYSFRKNEAGDALWIVIDSDGVWEFIDRIDGEGAVLSYGTWDGRFNRNANEVNRLTIIAQGKKGYFLINNEVAARLDLSSRPDGGLVSAATAYYTGHEVEGAVTKVENFAIWEMDGG